MSVREELIDYIKRGLQDGHPIESLRKALYDAGWHAYDIEESIKAAAESHVFPHTHRGSKEGIWEKMKHILSSPESFYDSVRGDEGFGDALRYFVVISILPALLSALMMGAQISTIANFVSQGTALTDDVTGAISAIGIIMAVASFPLYYIIGLIGVFVGAALLHIGVWVLSGKGKIEQTFKALVYGGMTPGFFSSIPTAIIILIAYALPLGLQFAAFLATIPFFLIFGIWGLYLEVKGISMLHRVSMLRALAMVLLIPLVILCVVAIVAATVFITFASISPVAWTGARATGFTEFGPPTTGGWKLDDLASDEQFQLVLINNMHQSIDVTDISVTVDGSACSVTSGTGTYGIGEPFTVNARCGPKVVGAQYSARVSLTYEQTASGISGLTDSGDLTGTVS